ncbi:MAG: anhydro-N-acetylmuramic acid kinase, partial [Gammaproteobacteria bacterium]|nr:anhydro-N-acetylmuramic acid kinase [Gammaproteobacteria bacterium]
MYYIGLMSGTSMDAVDTALLEFDNDKFQLIGYEQYPI